MLDWHAEIERVRDNARPLQLECLVVGAEDADNLGGAGLQAIADRAGMAVIVSEGSKYHSAKLFRPS